jgi:hypothetical protein
MNWITLAGIIAQYGIPVAEAIVKKWTEGSVPTVADFAELRQIATQTSVDILKQTLVKNGISLDSPKAKELLALLGA